MACHTEVVNDKFRISNKPKLHKKCRIKVNAGIHNSPHTILKQLSHQCSATTTIF